jgi:cyclophilin family peptidyl-prolyl cis-trans isomerase
MKKSIILLLISWLISCNCYAKTPIEKRPLIQIQTTKGDIIIRLFPDEAPLTCENFLSYANNQFYNNTLVHRVIDGFLIQAGGFDTNYKPKKTKSPIKNESRNGRSNLKGTVSMALKLDKDSASSQFFFNLADNTDLNYTTKRGRGYTVFAEVIQGYDTLTKISKIRTRRIIIHSELYKRNVPLYDFPEEDIIIKSIKNIRSIK